jgi:perosamine synthetase
LGEAEKRALSEVAEANFAGHGPVAMALAQDFARRTGRKHAFAVGTGRAALQLALRALDLPIGAKVAIPALTCPSVPAAVRANGLTPEITGIELRDLTLAIDAMDSECQAVVAPHAYGAAVNVLALRDRGLPWIEDCATSPGTLVAGKWAGSWGTIAIFSLASTKYITGGAGGILVMDDDALAHRIAGWLDSEDTAAHGLPDLNATLARVQFQRLDEFVNRRTAHATYYLRELSGHPRIERFQESPGHSYYRFVFQTSGLAEPIAAALRSIGIDARTAVNPWLGKESSYAVQSWKPRLLSLPIHPILTREQAEFVARETRHALDCPEP